MEKSDVIHFGRLAECVCLGQKERERPGQSAEGPWAMRMTGITRLQKGKKISLRDGWRGRDTNCSVWITFLCLLGWLVGWLVGLSSKPRR